MKALRIFGIVVVSLLAVIALVFGLRAYNGHKYTIMSTPVAAVPADAVPISGEYMRGYHLRPVKRAHPGVVVVYGGSEGSSNYEQAQKLADAGFELLSLYFFGQPGQQEKLSNVPLDHFDEVLGYVKANIPEPSPVTAVGASKGAELVALLAARDYPVDNIVAFAPASYSYAGLDFGSQDEKPSFTDRGEPVPFGSFRVQGVGFGPLVDSLLGVPPSYLQTYEASAAAAPADAAITLADFPGQALLFAGEQDQMWQSADAARALQAQSPRVEAHIYPDAGHLFSPDIEALGTGWERMLGGTAAGNAAAYADAQALLIERLGQWHGEMKG